jgi:hypothetical protein
MRFKQTLLSVVLPLCFGLVGGVIGRYVLPGSPRSATFETVQITKGLIVAPDGSSEKGCRISAEGTVTATGGLVANQVRGNVIIGRSLLASLNATQESLENQQIAAEISGSADRGGRLVLRNREGNFCPAKGPVSQGYETFVGFDKDKGLPSIYTQNIAQGPSGQSFFVCVKPRQTEQSPRTAKTSEKSGGRESLLAR